MIITELKLKILNKKFINRIMDKRTEKTTQHIPSVYMILSEFSNNSILYIIIYPRNVSTYTYNHQLILLANIWHSVVV